KRIAKPEPDWPVAFFDDDYLQLYRPMLTEERTAAEIDFIESALGLPAGARVLDLACGFGRHSIGMALRGYRVTGVDFNPRYLALAREESERRGVTVRWVEADMRELDFAREFDAVYSYFTSFGYFPERENERVIERVARSLTPGARFLIDLANRDWILTH